MKMYGSRTVVKSISLQVEQGEIIGLLGPNGAGKTTSFYMIVGMIKPNEGKIFLDIDNLAIIGVDFNLDDQKLSEAAELFIRRKPSTMNVEIESANYLTKYRIHEGTWYLSYVRSELDFKCRWKKKLFSSDYSVMSEMAVTDVEKENINKFKYSESTRYSDVLAEQVNQFDDPDFWGHDNIIKPDESIEEAVEKLSRRMKRRL